MTEEKHSARTDALRDDIVSAALAWHQFRNGVTERALQVAVERFLAGKNGDPAPPSRKDGLVAAPDNAAEPASPTLTQPVVPGEYVVYSDGSALKNPGPAGCGWVVISDGKVVYEGFESIGFGTNQVAEIRAAAHGLNDLPAGSTVDVFTDSLYVVQTMKGAFRKKANLEHWAFIDEALRRHRVVRFHHVRGHSGHEMNERADRLANRGALVSKRNLG